MAFFAHLRLLMWKNLLLQRKKICVSVFEILLPVLFAVIFFALRQVVEVHSFEPNKYYVNEIDDQGTVFNGWDREKRPRVFYTPNNTLITGVMEQIKIRINNSRPSGRSPLKTEFFGFRTPEDMIQSFSLNSTDIVFALQFVNVQYSDTDFPKNIRLTIRPEPPEYNRINWETTSIFPYYQQGPRGDYSPGYDQSGFLYIQRLVYEEITKYLNSSAEDILANQTIRMQRMPYPSYTIDSMTMMLRYMLGILLILSFMLFAIQTTKGIVYEKEKKLRESMKLMGLSPAAHWTSWFLASFIYVVFIMALYTVFMGVDGGKGAVLNASDPFLFFVFLLIYGISIISFCFLISTIAQRANIGAAVAGVTFFLTFCPYFYFMIEYQKLSRAAKLASCLLINLGMGLGTAVISQYEVAGDGVQWSNFHQPATVDDNFSLLDCILMLLGDTAIHFLLTWYIDNVYPGEFGVPKPWYFPFTSVYWCGSKQQRVSSTDIDRGGDQHFENEPTGKPVGISIQSLRKVFGIGPARKVAVDGMSLNLYEGQISVLLGHNGAGKTTTMSMLTGFIPSSGGTATVNGYDINTDINNVRKSLGLCPQHNILFDSLTVREHLEFFALLKGVPKSKVLSEVNQMTAEIGLATKVTSPAGTLSGGQKRKLSVGIALIGGSKIVVLDEPTSGMDPAARRQTWDILQRNREGRTLMLTTHFMDEADLLGDRIAIMAEGVVKCCGTSFFLKKLYGTGYHLVIVKQPNCDVEMITSTVQRHISSAALESEINAELSYLLPEDQVAQFADLFEDIERNMEKLGVSSFGTTATTMEEVFLKVEKTEEDEKVDDAGVENGGFKYEVNGATNGLYLNESKSGETVYELNGLEAGSQNSESDILAFNEGFRKVRGPSLEVSRFIGMFIKKALHTWRNPVLTIVQLLLPVLFTIGALGLSKIDLSGRTPQVPLTLDLSPFQGTVVPYQPGLIPRTEGYESAYLKQLKGTNNQVMEMTTNNYTAYFLNQAKKMTTAGYNKKMIISATFESNGSVLLFFNGQPYHAQPIALAYTMNAILKYFTSDEYSITTINYPLPRNYTQTSIETVILNNLLGFLISFCLLFGMAFLTSSFVYFLIKERLVGAKHLQVVSGVGPVVFWLSNLAWDFINYLIPTFLLLAVFGGFQTPAYFDDGKLGIVFFILLSYGVAVLPYMYAFQFLFKSPATGLVLIIIWNIVTGLGTLLTNFILKEVSSDDADSTDTAFMVLFPHYNFGKSFYNLYDLSNPSNPSNPSPMTPVKPQEDPLSLEKPGIGRYIFALYIQSFVFLAVTLAIDYQVFQKIWYHVRPKQPELPPHLLSQNFTFPEDSDVAAEKQRIQTLRIGSPESDALVLNSLYKRFGQFIAVDHLTVGIPEKECFGLLGQNGAGKTTTFKMLTGQEMVTDGNAHLWKDDVKDNIKKVQENMGYCPQFDALIDQMTGRETLAMYGRLRGIPEGHIKGVCDKLLDIMMLKQYADKPTSNYSGGNKRKLSTAIALVGDPTFIMLDEPSTGMDPKARRQLWTILSKVRECGRTLILTSHSMEECDALCTRIAIMVNGRFVCLGTPQHLKTKFGQGYTLIARMGVVETETGTVAADPQPLIQHMCNTFTNTQVFDDHQGYVHFQVPYAHLSLSRVFRVMEETKAQFHVEDYSVHQTTLEQVFLSFARAQRPPSQDKTSFCKRICCCC